MLSLAATAVEVNSDNFLSGLDLLARVADEARGEPLRSLEVGGTRKVIKRIVKVNKIHRGLRGEDRKRLEVALAKLKDCQEKLKLVQSRLSHDQREELSVVWNEAEGYYQIGDKNETDRIYTVNMWISAVRNSFLDGPIRNHLCEEFQINLVSSKEKVLSVRTVIISDSNSTAWLRVSVKSSAVKFYHFLENSSVKIKPSRIDSDEKEVRFYELPDHIATSCNLEFSTQNPTDTSYPVTDLKLNILTYLESSLPRKELGSYTDEMLRRKFELSFDDQSVLPLCWSMKKKVGRTNVIELSPKSPEFDHYLVPLDLTKKSKTFQHHPIISNMERPEKNLNNVEPSTVAAQSGQMLSLDSEPKKGVHFRKQTASVGSGLGIEADMEQMGDHMESLDSVSSKNVAHQSNQGSDSDSGLESLPVTSKPASVISSTFSSSASTTSSVASSIRKKYLSFKERHKPSSELWEMIKAVEKSLAAAEGTTTVAKLTKRSPLNAIIQPSVPPSPEHTLADFVEFVKHPQILKTYGKQETARNGRFGNHLSLVES